MRVLVVDSDVAASNRYARHLRGDGCAVDEVRSLEDGELAVADVDYDCVLFGDMGSLDRIASFLTEIRRERSNRPAVMVAQDVDAHHSYGLLTAGADDVISRDFGMEELVLRVRKHIVWGLSPGQERGIERLGRLALDRDRREVTVDGELVEVSPIPFSLLECLMEHQGLVVTTKYLIERGWDRNHVHWGNPVRVHLTRLRTALRGAVEIESVPGVGYRLTAISSELPPGRRPNRDRSRPRPRSRGRKP